MATPIAPDVSYQRKDEVPVQVAKQPVSKPSVAVPPAPQEPVPVKAPKIKVARMSKKEKKAYEARKARHDEILLTNVRSKTSPYSAVDLKDVRTDERRNKLISAKGDKADKKYEEDEILQQVSWSANPINNLLD